MSSNELSMDFQGKEPVNNIVTLILSIMCIIILFVCAVTITFTKELRNGFRLGVEINGGDLMRLIIVGSLAVSTGVCGVCSSYYEWTE